MRRLFSTIDRLLRGEFTSREDLQQGRVGINVGMLLLIGLLLGAIYGIFMGLYSAMRPLTGDESRNFLQLLATTAKVPLLFILTLVVTFPSLYVFSTLAGSRLKFTDTLRLLLAGITVNLALLASFGPVTGFFTMSTDSYHFMQLLNVILFGVGGIAGLVFMYKALNAVMESSGSSPPDPTQLPKKGAAQSSDRARLVFSVWTLIYGAVGAQMGWILRPFIGSPDLDFEFFRLRDSNFFQALFKILENVFG